MEDIEDFMMFMAPKPPEPTLEQYAAAAEALETPPPPEHVLSLYANFLNHVAGCDDGHAHEGPAFWAGVTIQTDHARALQKEFTALSEPKSED